MHLLRQFLFCVVFFTRIPIPFMLNFAGMTLGNSTWAYPLIGLLVGSLTASAFWVSLQLGLSAQAAAWLAVFTQILLTGGLHEDGLADTADGMAFGRTADQKLDIMRDSRIGSYGVLALIAVIGLRTALMGQLNDQFANIAIIIVAAILSRTSIGLLMFTTTRARPEGMASLAGEPNALNLTTCILLGLLSSSILLPYTHVMIAFLIMISVLILIRRTAISHFGGITGDVLGSAQQITEVFIIITLIILT